jgi:hypothetical protein
MHIRIEPSGLVQKAPELHKENWTVVSSPFRALPELVSPTFHVPLEINRKQVGWKELQQFLQ